MITKLAICISSLRKGGAEVLVTELIHHFDKTKFNILLIVLEKQYNTTLEEIVENSNITTIYLNKRPGFSFRSLFSLIKELYIFNPDIIFGHLGGAIYASLYSFFFTAKTIHTFHSMAEYELSGFKKRFMQIMYYLKRTIPVGVSQEVADSIKIAFNFKKQPQVIHNGINCEKFYYTKNTKEVVIGHLGRFEPVKNHQTIIKVFKEINNKYPNTRLLLIGNGSMFNHIKDLVIKLFLTEKVTFTGEVDDIENYYSKIDIFLMPSIYEGLSLAALEAMASGCVIVASDVGGMQELITHGENGFLVSNPLNVSEFTSHIETLINDKVLRNKIAKNNIRKSYEYSICNTAKQYEELFLSYRL